jgi:uncharacterized membrane protein
MKAKNLNFIMASIFLLVLAINLTSATLTLDNVAYNSEIAHDAETFDITFTLTNDETIESILELDWSASEINGVAGSNWNLSNAPSGIANDTSLSIIIPINFDSNELGEINGTVDVNGISFNFTVEILESPELHVESATLSGDTTTIIIANEGNIDFNTVNLTSSTGNFEINFSDEEFYLGAGEHKEITISLVSEDNNLVGTNTLTITATAEDGTNAEGTISRGSGFCEGIPQLEKLEIKDISFSNEGISNSVFGDDTEWYPFEEIEVTIEIENDGNYDMVDVELTWGLYDNQEEEWVIDPDEETEFDLDEGDVEEVTFTFELDNDLDVDLEDLTNGNDYTFYIKAEGKIDDSSSSNDNERTCASENEDIEIVIEDDFVILTNLDLIYDVTCGSQLIINAEVWNIGTDRQKDFYVRVSNGQLGIYQEFTIDKLQSFDAEDITIVLEIPESAEERNYDLKWEVYDRDNDIYESNDEDSEFYTILNVAGNCEIKPTLQIDAILDEAIEGKEVTITVQVTNLGDSTQMFDLNLASYNSWVESYEISTEYLVVKGGETKEVIITLNLKENIAGMNEFELLLTSENGIETQPIEVEVLEKKGFLGITGFSIAEITYTSGLTALILIIIIIILALLVTRKLRK